MAKIIVSYDATDNDHDALALGRLFQRAGAELALAYVRHTRESERGREELAHHEAEQMLAGGSEWLGEPEIARHVVLSASTGEGLRRLAEAERADVIVFGSEYRTAPGHVDPGTSARHLLEGGPVAVALAPAGLRALEAFAPQRIAVAGDDASALETAQALVDGFDGELVAPEGAPDLLVIGSRAEAPVGRVLVSAACEYLIETATCPVLVTPRGVTLGFDARASIVA